MSNGRSRGLLDELNAIEVFENPEQGRMLGENTKKQEQLFYDIEVEPPS